MLCHVARLTKYPPAATNAFSEGYVCWLPITDSMTPYTTYLWVFVMDISSSSDTVMRQEAKSSSDFITQTYSVHMNDFLSHFDWVGDTIQWKIFFVFRVKVDVSKCLTLNFMHCSCTSCECRITVYRVSTNSTSWWWHQFLIWWNGTMDCN